jgi:hypothetical protein
MGWGSGPGGGLAHSVSAGQNARRYLFMTAGWQSTDSEHKLQESVMAGVLVIVVLVLLIVFLAKRV